MIKVITYGTYDCLHHGHINLLKNAKKLGDFLIVGITSDEFDRSRGKIEVVQSLAERIAAVQATGLADQIVIEEYAGQKISDIQKYGVDIFTVGSDWVGQFDYLNRFCKVVYLPRTKGISSTEIRTNKSPPLRLGVVGYKNPSERLIKECQAIHGVPVSGIVGNDLEEVEKIAKNCKIKNFGNDLEKLYACSDAVYIVERIDRHADLIKDALHHRKHVIVEAPIFLSVADAQHCYRYANDHNLILFEAVKTRHFPAYKHLILLLNSGLIGEIKDIEVTFSQNLEDVDYGGSNKYEGAMFSLASYLLLPIIQLLGRNFEKSFLFVNKEKDFDVFVKGLIRYKTALATFKAGAGVKSEGQLIITGTNGYVYVPAPWWKTDYFEIRYEDLRSTKKYFWPYEGDGFRYEIIDFLHRIRNPKYRDIHYLQEDSMVVTKIIEDFSKGNYDLF